MSAADNIEYTYKAKQLICLSIKPTCLNFKWKGGEKWPRFFLYKLLLPLLLMINSLLSISLSYTIQISPVYECCPLGEENSLEN